MLGFVLRNISLEKMMYHYESYRKIILWKNNHKNILWEILWKNNHKNILWKNDETRIGEQDITSRTS